MSPKNFRIFTAYSHCHIPCSLWWMTDQLIVCRYVHTSHSTLLQKSMEKLFYLYTHADKYDTLFIIMSFLTRCLGCMQFKINYNSPVSGSVFLKLRKEKTQTFFNTRGWVCVFLKECSLDWQSNFLVSLWVHLCQCLLFQCPDLPWWWYPNNKKGVVDHTSFS